MAVIRRAAPGIRRGQVTSPTGLKVPSETGSRYGTTEGGGNTTLPAMCWATVEPLGGRMGCGARRDYVAGVPLQCGEGIIGPTRQSWGGGG